MADPATAPHEAGVLVIDDSGDRKAGTKTAHVARQYLGSIGKLDGGIVAVTSLWADERIYYPLHVRPYTPAARLPKGKADPDFRTKPQLAVELVDAALDAGFSFRAVVADCFYGENATFEGALAEAGLPFVAGAEALLGDLGPGRRGPHAGGGRAGAAVGRPRRSGRLDAGGASVPRRPRGDLVGGRPAATARTGRTSRSAWSWPRPTRPRCRR